MLSTSIHVRSIALASKSPRAPQLDMETALDRAMALYDREQLAEVPTEVAAKDLGYKSANNGAAMSTFATMRYFGLVERSSPGKLRVTRDVRRYRHAPDETLRAQLRSEWLAKPPVFSDLLEKYPDGLPSDATVRFYLIEELGFRPGLAETVLEVFKRSVAFVGADGLPDLTDSSSSVSEDVETEGQASPTETPDVIARAGPSLSQAHGVSPLSSASPSQVAVDQEVIPIRLSGGRRAWIALPTDFYERDKDVLKRQIDLVMTDDLD